MQRRHGELGVALQPRRPHHVIVVAERQHLPIALAVLQLAHGRGGPRYG
jgi:hypothetical protein